MRIHYLQHVPFEGLGYIQHWIETNHHAISATKLYDKPFFPSIDDIDCLIIMGGPMGVYDEEKYPWLEVEKKFIKSAIENSKTVIGICLGAQLIAESLGAKVYPNNYKEIGWYPVTLTNDGASNILLHAFPKAFPVFHWHGDTFDLPEHSVHLLESTACKHQAFIFKEKVIGLQFHLEATPDTLIDMITHGKDELVKGPYVQLPETILSKSKETESANLLLKTILDRLLNRL